MSNRTGSRGGGHGEICSGSVMGETRKQEATTDGRRQTERKTAKMQDRNRMRLVRQRASTSIGREKRVEEEEEDEEEERTKRKVWRCSPRKVMKERSRVRD